MMLSVISLSMLAPDVIRHLVCGSKQSWFLNLNLIYETLSSRARSDLLTSMLQKLNFFSFERSNNSGAVDLKMDGSVLEEETSFKILGFLF